MPRIANSIVRRAYAQDPLLPALLGVCRDLSLAANELRWLREHVDELPLAPAPRPLNTSTRRKKRIPNNDKHRLRKIKEAKLRDLVKQRSRGTPLQYLLGTEFFGELELKCGRGVLVPRQDTASTIAHLARLIRDPRNTLPNELRVLDLCTGTGCIPFLFGHELRETRHDISYRMLGVDVSTDALTLATKNLRRFQRKPSSSNLFNTSTTEAKDDGEREDGHNAKGAKVLANFMWADILNSPFEPQIENTPLPLMSAMNLARHPPFWDIVISNPPYISPDAYRKTTARSVRGFEPRLALVPPHPSTIPSSISTGVGSYTTSWPEKTIDTITQDAGDTFYVPILNIAAQVEAKVVLVEVADVEQAVRVARLGENFGFEGVEIWRDRPDDTDEAFPSSPSSPYPKQHSQDSSPGITKKRETKESKNDIPIVGAGNVRCVVFWRGNTGAAWLGKETQNDSILRSESHAMQPSMSRTDKFDGRYHADALLLASKWKGL
ncbi:unnamed protein product [Periconia digitata]|uniref:S-adenosyl-L-methionine-dependent methyltransferase n=1 Tax=Periconia digitata TaxID=1303443 RepID=A0A9W4XJB7_9PLEO|nr:unnamed protein product [Periconia digitata]